MLILIHFFLMLGKFKEKEIILIPPNYSGVVTIIYDQIDGQKMEYIGEKRAYLIPQCGILKTKFREQFGFVGNLDSSIMYVHYDGNKIIDTINYQKEYHKSSNNSVIACCRGNGGEKSDYYKYNFEHISWFKVDSARKIYDYNDYPQHLFDRVKDCY